MSASTAQADRAVGALVGLAVGDALGAPVEFLRRDSFPPVTGMMAGGTFRLPAGAGTDDTAMALCLADSLLVHPDLDAADLLSRFCRWVELGENTSTGKAVGIGQATLAALGRFTRSGALEAQRHGPRGDGNGALMRLAPVAVRHWREPALAARIATAQSQTTHASALSEAACASVALTLCALIGGREWPDASRPAVDPAWPTEVADLAGRGAPPDRATVRSTGYVVDTLQAALWAVDITDSFEAAVLAAVNLGDDADTVGAVTGQLAGARYGLSAIPSVWRTQLVRGNEIEARARELFAAGSTS